MGEERARALVVRRVVVPEARHTVVFVVCGGTRGTPSCVLVRVQFDVPAAPLVAALRQDGLFSLTAGAGDVLRLVPPLIVTSADVHKASDMIATRAFDVLNPKP